MNNNNAKQLTRFPYCRIYRRFLKNLTENHLIRKHGDGLLYRYIVLFALANFRSAIRTINGQRYVMHAGEWVSTYSELCEKLHLHTHRQLHEVLYRLSELHFVESQNDPHQKIVRFKITCWPKTNTTLSYSAPCPKDKGFFFFPVKQLTALIGTDRCSEADMLLDLWINTFFQDPQVPGSELCPVVYFHNEGSLPLVSCAFLAARWNVSKATVHRVLKKFESIGLLTSYHCTGKRGSVLMLRGYLSTMFCMDDASPTAQELGFRMQSDHKEDGSTIRQCPLDNTPKPSTETSFLAEIVSKPDIPLILENLRNALFASGFRCSACSHALYRLSNLSDCGKGEDPYDLAIFCGSSGALYHFSLKLESGIGCLDDVDVEVI